MSDIGMTVGLIKALGSPDPAVIEGAVSDWLDDHPEATTTVEDGAISYAKLDSSLQATADDVSDLKTQKAPGIFKHVIAKTELLYDSSNAQVSNPKVFGSTKQEEVFAYNIADFHDNPEWKNDSQTVSTMTVDSETGEIDIVVTAVTADKVVFKPKGVWTFTDEQIAEISECDNYYAVYDVDTSLTSNQDIRPHFEWKLNGTTKTNESFVLYNGTGTRTRSLSDIISNGFNQLGMWFEIKRLNGNTLVEGDYFKLKKFEVKLNTSAHQYTIINANNFTVEVGETSATIPYTLRGVPDDNGNVIVDGDRYTCDYIDPTANKIVRLIDSQIDACVDTEVNWSDYVLQSPIEEDASTSVCDNIKALGTAYPTTNIDATAGYIGFDYLVDTKTYIDSSAGFGYVTPEQYGAVGDGVTDDTDALQAMFDSNESIIKMPDNKTYMVSDEIIIGNSENVMIFGGGSRIKRIAGNLSDVSNNQYVLSTGTDATGRSSIIISDLVIDANASNYTDDVDTYGYNILPCLMVYGFDNVRLNNVEVTDTLTGRGISIQQAFHGMVEQCYIHDIGQPENVKVIFPNYSCGGISFGIKDGSYSGSTLSIKNSTFEKITASCSGSTSQYAELIGNTYIECQDVVMEQSETNPDNELSINKHRLIKNNHMIRCANSLFSASCAMSALSDTTGKTVIIDGNVIEDAGDLDCYDLKSNPRTYARKAIRMLALINDNNNIKSPYETIVITNNYLQFADDLTVAGTCNVFGDSIQFRGNTIIAFDSTYGNATINSINEDGIIVISENTFKSGGIVNAGCWERIECFENVFYADGVKRDVELITNNASNIMNVCNNKMLDDTANLIAVNYDGGKYRVVGNVAKNLITCSAANCYGSGIVANNIADNEFVDTTNSGSYTVSGTIAYTIT